MPDIKRQIRLVTQQAIIPDRPAEVEGFPMRAWNIEVFLLNDAGEEIPATIFDKVTYTLHPTFPPNRQKQVFKEPPFRIEEEGWGEFDFTITLTAKARGGDHAVQHDLNFQQERYETPHTITFRNPKPELLALLAESGPTENGARKGGAGADKKKGRKDKSVDLEKLADGLQKLSEENLLHVVQMIHDHKTQETYTKNDVENGEFHVDLYTLPDNLVKMLWEFTSSKVEL